MISPAVLKIFAHLQRHASRLLKGGKTYTKKSELNHNFEVVSVLFSKKFKDTDQSQQYALPKTLYFSA